MSFKEKTFTGPTITMRHVVIISIILYLSYLFGFVFKPEENFFVFILQKLIFFPTLIYSIFLCICIISCIIIAHIVKRCLQSKNLKGRENDS